MVLRITLRRLLYLQNPLQRQFSTTTSRYSNPKVQTAESTSLSLVWKSKCFEGFQKVYRHASRELNCPIQFSIYEPIPRYAGEKFHVLFFLSGRQCNEQNFILKTAFQKSAEEGRFIVVGPDTSPRGCDYDKGDPFTGESAGWYVDALTDPWKKNYKMYSYMTKELPQLINSSFPTSGKFGITGHSMGGHGAVVCGLRNPDLFQSISGFCFQSSPSTGEFFYDKVFLQYIGLEHQSTWWKYDSSELIKRYSGPFRNILVDQGADDEWKDVVLLPEKLTEAVKMNPNPNAVQVNLRIHKDYDHSYLFVSSFMDDHFKHHAKYLSES